MTYFNKFSNSPIARPVMLIIFLISVAIFVGVKDARKEKIRADFSTFSLAAGRVMFSGGDPYDKAQVKHNYKYFPTNAILLYPFTKISVYAAQGIWFALNLGLVIWAFISMRDMLRPIRIPWWVYFLSIGLTFRLIVMNLRLGQWNTSVFCLSIIGLRQLQIRQVWGATLLSLAITLKFMPCIFLAYMAARRRWKWLGLTAAATVFWIGVFPVVVLGPARTGDLLARYYAVSVERVDEMTTGKEVSSVSLHSTIYRALTPAQLELKDTWYRANVLNLPRDTASGIAKLFSVILLIAAFAWLVRQGRRNDVNPLGDLLMIGLCYLFWFLAAPGVRHGQLISIIPLTFTIVTAIAIAPPGRLRIAYTAGYIVLLILYTIPAEIIDDTSYNHWLEASGVIAWALVFHTFLGLAATYNVGRGPLPERVIYVADT